MTYRPDPDMKAPTMLSFLALAAGMLCYVAGAMVQRYAWVCQLLCFAGVITSLYLLVRWRMTWFVYAIRPRGDDSPVWEETALAGNISLRYTSPDLLDLIVVKGQGNRAGGMECVLGLDSLLRAETVSRKPETDAPRYDRDAIRRQYPGTKVYEYIQTWHWQYALQLVFRDGDSYAVLLLDLPADSAMGELLLGCTRR